jgi:serine O-acetyltransferase
MVGIPARPTLVEAETYQRDFVPYGTPCGDKADVARAEGLREEVEALRAEVAALRAERSTQERDRA